GQALEQRLDLELGGRGFGGHGEADEIAHRVFVLHVRQALERQRRRDQLLVAHEVGGCRRGQLAFVARTLADEARAGAEDSRAERQQIARWETVRHASERLVLQLACRAAAWTSY